MAPSKDDEDDYMSMAITEPSSTLGRAETSIQRRARQKREAEVRAHQPSKAESARQTEIKRDEALNTSLPTTSKGYQMMARLGFKAGSALGREGNEHARTEPLGVVVKEGRAGVGLEGEKKRKFGEEVGAQEGGDESNKKRETEGEFRERQGREREEKRVESMCWGAMKVLEGFESAQDGGGVNGRDDGEGEMGKKTTEKPTKQINVLWRGLVRDRQEKERERRMRYDLHQSLSRHAAYDDPDEDEQDKQAWGREEEEVEEEDHELEEFNQLEPAERLGRMLEYLRNTWRYCFWCKYHYPDKGMEGCPGLTEDEHG